MVTLTAVRPEARAPRMTRSDKVRRCSGVGLSGALGSSRLPSALTIITSRGAWAAAEGIKAAAPARARNSRRCRSVILGLVRRDRAKIGAVEAAPSLHCEQDRAQIGN